MPKPFSFARRWERLEPGASVDILAACRVKVKGWWEIGKTVRHGTQEEPDEAAALSGRVA